MERTIIPFPTMPPAAEDPAMARALFFADVEYRELLATVPQAPAATDTKNIY